MLVSSEGDMGVVQGFALGCGAVLTAGSMKNCAANEWGTDDG